MNWLDSNNPNTHVAWAQRVHQEQEAWASHNFPQKQKKVTYYVDDDDTAYDQRYNSVAASSYRSKEHDPRDDGYEYQTHNVRLNPKLGTKSPHGRYNTG